MTCLCACHASSGAFKLACTEDKRSSGVPGLKSCSPCDRGASVFHACDWRRPLQSADNRIQARCFYPGCKDEHPPVETCVPPRWTFNGVCKSCRGRYGQLLGWLIEDFNAIKQPMEIPSRVGGDGSKHMSPKSRSYGHPAERPSEAVRLIVDRFAELEDDLREHLGDRVKHLRQPGVQASAEVYRLAAAYDYITQRFDHLCTFPLADDWATIMVDLHSKLRSSLGLTRLSQKLPTPCPSCDVAALVRSVGQIDCGNCHRTIDERQYPFLARMVLDDVIAQYDAANVLA